MALSDEILCAREDECLHPRRRESHRARTEGSIFVVGVVAVQTFLTPPRCANNAARLLASTEPSSSLPGLLCVVGAIAIQWRLVDRSDTKRDRVESVTFDVGAAARQQKRLLAELHYVQHGGESCAPIVVTDDGFDDSIRSRTILVNASAAAHASAELCAFSRQFGMRCISDCLFCARCSHRRVPQHR